MNRNHDSSWWKRTATIDYVSTDILGPPRSLRAANTEAEGFSSADIPPSNESE